MVFSLKVASIFSLNYFTSKRNMKIVNNYVPDVGRLSVQPQERFSEYKPRQAFPNLIKKLFGSQQSKRSMSFEGSLNSMKSTSLKKRSFISSKSISWIIISSWLILTSICYLACGVCLSLKKGDNVSSSNRKVNSLTSY